MSESMVAHSEAESHAPDAQGLTAGALLRDARESAGVHIAALAVSLKVPVVKLEALESGNFSALPDVVFVRALASSVCRMLNVDPQPVLALLPQGRSPNLSAGDSGLNAPVREFAGKSSVPFSVLGSNPLVWGVGLLLIGAALMIFLPRGFDADLLAMFKRQSANSTNAVPDVVGGMQENVSAVVPAPSSPASAPGVDMVVSQGQTPESRGGATHAATMPSVTSSVAASDRDSPTGVLAFKARGESWIQVREATGAVVLQRNLALNEQVSVSGALPLAVVIGRADATEVFVRGKPYDLRTVSRENVARFEVK